MLPMTGSAAARDGFAMKMLAVFNNKGGVGKSTLTFHLAAALGEIGVRTLVVDLDPQSNLTLYGVRPSRLEAMWSAEDPFIEDFEQARTRIAPKAYEELLRHPRSTHFLLKAAEDGAGEPPFAPPVINLDPMVGLLPGRLSLHTYEDKLSTRWSDIYKSDPQAVRLVTRIRSLCAETALRGGFQVVLIDTSPSLGILNRVIISTSDAFMVPCFPDMFSLYGIRNIGRALVRWRNEFEIIFRLLSSDKRAQFPAQFVKMLGYVIVNARKYSSTANPWNLAAAHYEYASQIPDTIANSIPTDLKIGKQDTPLGGTAVMYSYSTLPSMAQKYRQPIWRLPGHEKLTPKDKSTIGGNAAQYRSVGNDYRMLAAEVKSRLQLMDGGLRVDAER